jgi:hypothetical protein
MAYTVHYTAAATIDWHHLAPFCHKELETAVRRANSYAMDHGGYVCVKDELGRVLYGTDPAQLDE